MMESLALPTLNVLTGSRSNFHEEQSRNLSGKARYLRSSNPSSLKFRPSHITYPLNSGGIRMAAGGEDVELKQMRDMAAAKKRENSVIRAGKVKVLTPREAGYAIQLSEKTLPDVRPSTECKKTYQQRALAVREGWVIDYCSLTPGNYRVGVFLVAEALFIGAQQVVLYIQDIRSH